jgi:PAS domain S-box-containing protein
VELEKRQKELQQSKEELQQIFDTVNATIYSFDINTNETLVSEGIERLYGYSKKEFASNPSLWKETVHPEDKQLVDQFAKNITQGYSS